MNYLFEIGKEYRASDNGLDPIIILKRTDKTIWVANTFDRDTKWRMRIKKDSEGNEYVTDSMALEPRTPKSEYNRFTYKAEWSCT